MTELERFKEMLKAHLSAVAHTGNCDGYVDECMGSEWTGPYGGDPAFTVETIHEHIDKVYERFIDGEYDPEARGESHG